MLVKIKKPRHGINNGIHKIHAFLSKKIRLTLRMKQQNRKKEI